MGDLKNPSGTLAGPRGFSNPLWASGDLGEDPLEKTRITYIYFLYVHISAISRGFVCVYPLGDLCIYAQIPQTGGSGLYPSEWRDLGRGGIWL